MLVPTSHTPISYTYPFEKKPPRNFAPMTMSMPDTVNQAELENFIRMSK